jgi:hypothetical protein
MKLLYRSFLLMLLITAPLFGQLGTVSIPTNAQIDIPVGATFCADTIFANNPGFGTLTYPNINNICRAVVIPVELLSLSATYEGGAVTLQWRSTGERNCAGYEIQSALPEGAWRMRGFVPANAPGMRENRYAFIDRSIGELPRGGILLYRLRQVDNDGASDYSPVVEVWLIDTPESPELRAAYPNPASSTVFVEFTIPEEAPVQLALYSLLGEELARLCDGALFPRGTHVIPVNTAQFRNGSYIVSFSVNGISETRLFSIKR